MNLTKAKEKLIETLCRENEFLRGVVDQQHQIIDHQPSERSALARRRSTRCRRRSSWRRLGKSTPRSRRALSRTPEGEICCASEADNEPDPDPPISASIDDTFLGRLAWDVFLLSAPAVVEGKWCGFEFSHPG